MKGQGIADGKYGERRVTEKADISVECAQLNRWSKPRDELAFSYVSFLPSCSCPAEDFPLSITTRNSSTVHPVSSISAMSASSPQYSALAAKAAEEVSSKWKGTTANGGRTKNYIGGEFFESQAEKWLEVHDPVSQRPDSEQSRPRLKAPENNSENMSWLKTLGSSLKESSY